MSLFQSMFKDAVAGSQVTIHLRGGAVLSGNFVHTKSDRMVELSVPGERSSNRLFIDLEDVVAVTLHGSENLATLIETSIEAEIAGSATA